MNKKSDPKYIRFTLLDGTLFDRPLASGHSTEKSTFYSYLTFKNIVLVIGLVTFLVFLGSIASARIAFLFAALMGLAGLILFEMSGRRKWEADLTDQLHRMSSDHDRLVRETARNRNDTAQLKKNLADAGTVARNHGRNSGEDVEHRMIKSIADTLSKLGDTISPEEAAQLSIFEGDVPEEIQEPLTGGTDETVGNSLSSEQVLQLVHASVRQDRIDLFMQPIVNLPQRKLRFYELFSRIRIKEGVYLPAARYIAVAMQQDLVPVIDNLLLLRGLQMVRDTEEENFNRAFFCNITSLTLNDPKFMGDLVEFIAQNRTLAPRLVFEMGQRDLASMSPDILPILDGLSQLGCRFSMDQVRNLSFDFAQLEARHIRFVKIETKLILQEMKGTGGLQRVKRLKSELDRNGIDLIAEKTETDKQVLELLDVEIDYGQGYLFGKPYMYEKNISDKKTAGAK